MSPLIEEMRAQIHATPLPGPGRRRGWRRPREIMVPAAAGAAAIAACVLAAFLFVSGAGSRTPPAYAAVLHTVGGVRTVTITLREERDVPALNARLAAERTRIRVVPVVRGCDAPVHSVSNGRVLPGPARTLLSPPTSLDGRLLRVVSQTISVDTIAGRTFVLPTSSEGLHTFGGGVVVGPAPRCVGIGRPEAFIHRRSSPGS